jgi:hypothetical protein
MISDGIMPSNEGRGYVLRRLIRRAARHGRKLGIDGQFLAELSKTVIHECKDGYPELDEKKEFILNVLTQEESKFNKTIDQNSCIKTMRTKKIKIRRNNPGVFHFDGDPVMGGENLEVEIVARALNVVTTDTKEKVQNENLLQVISEYFSGLKPKGEEFLAKRQSHLFELNRTLLRKLSKK